MVLSLKKIKVSTIFLWQGILLKHYAWRMKNFLCVKRTYTGVGYLCIRIFN